MHPEEFDELTRGPTLAIAEASNDRARAELYEFARRRFLSQYHAEIADDSPRWLGAFDHAGELRGVFGLRDAASGFFCQHYLDQPLHEILTRRCGHPVRNDEIVEITHLCANRSGLLRALIPLVPGVLLGRGYRYLACTATQCLARFFERQGLPALTVAAASAEALPAEDRGRWGAYYASNPRVLAGDIRTASAFARRTCAAEGAR